MRTELQIREATFQDVGPLVDLASNAFREAYRLLDDPADIEDYVSGAFTPQAFASILEDPSSTLLVALVDGEFVGYAHIAHSEPPACVTGPAPVELARLYLLQSSVGKGYGAALMEAVNAVARRARCKTIWLGVYWRNDRARAFYKNWGFVDMGTKEFIFGSKTYADPVMAAPVRE